MKKSSICELLAYKDKLHISGKSKIQDKGDSFTWLCDTDCLWEDTVKTFCLEGYRTLHYLCKLCQQLDSTLPVLRNAPSGEGYHIPFLDFLCWHLGWLPTQSSAEPILLKLAFDGAVITSGKRVPQELGGFQFLHPGKSLSLIKSPSNCHVWVVYIGGETEEELWQELQSSIQV